MRLTATRITVLAAASLALAGAPPATAQTAASTATSTSSGATAAPTGGLRADLDGLSVSPGALLERTVTIRGQLDARDAGRSVSIERRLLDGTWQPVAWTLVERDGAFSARWLTDQIGRVTLRATVDRSTTATAAASPLTAQLTVFAASTASWYGPGFFGRRTACGKRLKRSTVGVAHRTLPCGTRVELYYKGRTITAPVIDRGPFHKGRDWDLTRAAARKLRMRATGRIGVLVPLEATLVAAKRRR